MLYVTGMKTVSEFPDVYLDFIQQYGFPSALELKKEFCHRGWIYTTFLPLNKTLGYKYDLVDKWHTLMCELIRKYFIQKINKFMSNFNFISKLKGWDMFVNRYWRRPLS